MRPYRSLNKAVGIGDLSRFNRERGKEKRGEKGRADKATVS